jgi:hypothetical protein
MRTNKLLSFSVAVFLVYLYTGCSSGRQGSPQPQPLKKADLVVVSLDPQLGPVGFCLRGSNHFTVNVKNQGDAAAPVSTVTIEFLPGGSFTKEVFGPGPNGALPAGVIWGIQFPDSPPSGCFNPDCEFSVTVDSGDDVFESNEGNNLVSGICIG